MNVLELKVPPLVVVLFVAILMFAVALFLPSFQLAWPLRMSLAMLAFAPAVLILMLSFQAFKRFKTSLNPLQPEQASSLLQSGIFAYSRNPIYLAMLLWLVALAMILASAFSLLGCVLFCGYLTHFQIKPEERALKAKFGQEYDQYLGRVRRWL